MAHTFCIDLTAEQQSRLLGIARKSITTGLRTRKPLSLDATALAGTLAADLANFVTLQLAGDLRGCVGSLEPKGPLAQGVAVMAYHAAFRDSRFPPLEFAELEQIHIEISVLSVPEPIECNSETELLGKLVPAEDGLLLEDRGRRVTFLPKVWDRLADPGEFVRQLKQKAGWPADYWSSSIQAHRYRAISFDEDAVAA
jgi:AmmeMemoRadiSam system protein A